jgi:hypothetical protein
MTSMAKKTKTRSKTKQSVKVKTAVALLAIAGAAYAGFGLLGQRGYISFYTQCHDGSRMWWDGKVARIQSVGGQSDIFRSPPCMTSRALRQQAQQFCSGATNPTIGKVGVNRYKVSRRCRIIPQQVEYGYGYSYYMSLPPAAEAPAKPSSKTIYRRY